jgi:hypothetical protein
MRMPEPPISRAREWEQGRQSEGKTATLQRKCAACASGQGLCPKCAEEERMQRKPLAAQITPLVERQVTEELDAKKAPAGSRSIEGEESVPPIVHEVLRSPGQPLDAATRAFFEPRFGYDFSQVRVHTDAKAAESARAINALAYTVGRDVVFGAGQYAPGMSGGRKLLAHELTHVVQQGAGLPAAGSKFSQPSDTCEREAEQAAHTVTASHDGTAASTASVQSTAFGIQRTAASCPASWRTIVSSDHSRALTMVDIARGKLSAYNGTSPHDVRSALDRHFKASSITFAGWVNLNLGFLRQMARLADYDCEDTTSWWCSGSGTAAKTLWCVPLVNIRVCQPLYFSLSNKGRSTTLIHEWVHKYGCNFDLGYSHEPDYPSQWTITALLNADPFAEFVNDVNP